MYQLRKCAYFPISKLMNHLRGLEPSSFFFYIGWCDMSDRVLHYTTSLVELSIFQISICLIWLANGDQRNSLAMPSQLVAALLGSWKSSLTPVLTPFGEYLPIYLLKRSIVRGLHFTYKMRSRNIIQILITYVMTVLHVIEYWCVVKCICSIHHWGDDICRRSRHRLRVEQKS